MDADASERPAADPSADDSDALEQAVRAREQEELRSFERRAQWWRAHYGDPRRLTGRRDPGKNSRR